MGDAHVPDVFAGVLELNEHRGNRAPQTSPPSMRPIGLFMLSFFVDVEATLSRLANLGLGGSPRRIRQPTPNGPITIATVHDPDGVLILLTPGSITQANS